MMNFLQTTNPISLDKLTESTNALSKTSIELAQAASDYGALKIVFGVFIVIVILMMLVMITSHVYILRKVNLISEASLKVLKYFDNLSNRTIGKEEGNAIIREALNRCKALTKYYILRIRFENHIDNKEVTQQKIEKISQNSFAELSSHLSKFICVDKSLSHVIMQDDCESLDKLINQLVYQDKDSFTISSMDQSVELFFDGIKLEYTKKLENL